MFRQILLIIALFLIGLSLVGMVQQPTTVIEKPDLPPYPAALQVGFGVLASLLAEWLGKGRNVVVTLGIVGGLSIVGGIVATALAVGFGFGEPQDVVKFLFAIFTYSQTTFGIINAVNKIRAGA